jgi:hypothetical protein
MAGGGPAAWRWELGILTMALTCSEGRRPRPIGRASGVRRSASTTRTGLAIATNTGGDGRQGGRTRPGRRTMATDSGSPGSAAPTDCREGMQTGWRSCGLTSRCVVVLLASLREARNGDGDAERMPLGSTDACSGERCSLAYWSSGRRRPDPAILLGEVMAGKVLASDDEELQWPCKAVVLCRRGNRRRAAVRAAGHAREPGLRFFL